MLFDREFYRAALVSDLWKCRTPVIFPTKKYAWVKHQMRKYLQGTGGFIVGNVFSQTASHYPFQQTAFVWLVLVGKDGQMPWAIRDAFIQGGLTYRQAMQSLHGFFTNYTPWQNSKGWVRYLIRTYKRRWNIETGFALLNKVHEMGRERSFTYKLASLNLRGWIYNCWQSWRLDQIRNLAHHRDYTLYDFKERLKDELEENLYQNCLMQARP